MNNDKDVIENDSLDNLERVKTLSPSMMVVKRFFRNKLAIVGLVILVFMLLLSVVGPLFSPYGETQVFHKKDIMKKEKRGSLYTLTIRGGREETINFFSSINTVFYEVLPLSLEEIFISETEVVGYDIQKLILG